MTKAPTLCFAALISLLALSATDAAAHGGVWRGPGGLPPTARFPTDPMPPPAGPLTPPPNEGGPSIPTPPGGPVEVPGGTPTTGGGPVSVPEPPPGLPAPARPRGTIPSSGPGLGNWVYWWNLNRERILDLRRLQGRRLREWTAESTPHFFGTGGGRNVQGDPTGGAREEILEALLAAARDADDDVATGAIIALGKAGDPRALPVLTALVKNPRANQTVVESAALALGMIGARDAEVRAFLTDLAGNRGNSTRTRAFATLALGFLGEMGGLPALMQRWHAKESSREVPAAALMGIGLLGDELVVPDLARALGGPPRLREADDFLRAYTATALGMIRSRAGIPALLAAADDKEEEVRRQVALSLGALGGPEDEQVLKTLATLLANDRDLQVRCFAAVSLGEIGAPAAADALLYAYRKGKSELVPYAALGLGLLARKSDRPEVEERIAPFLRAQLEERGSNDLRGALAVALGICGDQEAVKPLLRLHRASGEPYLRGHAAMALGLIGAREAIPNLRKSLEDGSNPDVQREVALALALLADREAEAILASTIREGTTEFVRGSAAVALGRLASPATARALIEVLADRSERDTTRAFAAVALGLVMDPNEVPLLSRVGEHFNHRMTTTVIAEVLTFL